MYMIRIVAATPSEERKLNYELGICLWSGYVVSSYSAAKEVVRDAKGICPLVHLEILKRVSA